MISLLLGLGNPGLKYSGTRHNLGFEVIHDIVERNKLEMSRAVEYDWTEKRVGSKKIILAMPKTFMNLSGLALTALLQKNNLEPSRVLVIVDDINIPLGSVRIRKSGSDGGHNGLASIIYELESEDFPRMRLGIGPLPEDQNQSDFVTDKFTEDEIGPVLKMIRIASEAAMFACRLGLDEAMTRYNRNPA